MINILQVMPVLGYGGVEKVVRNYYQKLDHSRYHFDFISHGEAEDYHRELEDGGSRIYYFKTIGQIGIPAYIQQIKNKVNLGKYDIVHIHTGDLTGVYAYAYRRCKARKIICHGHTTTAVSKNRAHIQWLLRYLAVKESDVRIGCGKDAGRFCFGRHRFILLPNAIDFSAFRNVREDRVKRVKDELGIPEGVKVIGHVGAFNSFKNQSFLIDIFKEIHAVDSGVRLVLVGDGPDREAMESKVKAYSLEKYVIFCGIRDDVNVLLQIFDIFMLPSVNEGLPVVGVEAQVSGVTCLFSETIDHSIDFGCDNVSFLPVNQGPGPWKEAALKSFASLLRPSPQLIYKAMLKKGYEINVTTKVLRKIYDKLAAQ